MGAIPQELLRRLSHPMHVAKPTESQAEAGNYRKAHLRVHGLDITIETPKGRRRRPEWPAMAAHYGYIKRTEGNDGDALDVFLGPDRASEMIYVIDQPWYAANHRFDEHKVMIGFRSQEEAIAAYRASFTDDWKVGPVTAMTIQQFKNWLMEGDQTKPIAEQVSQYSADFEGKHPRDKNGRFSGKSDSQRNDRHDKSTHPNIAALVKDALAGSGDHTTQQFDFPVLSDAVTDRIRNDTGVETKHYRATIKGQQVRHIINRHGNESRRGQLDVQVHDIERLAELLTHADTIKRIDDSNDGNPMLEFKKRINGHVFVVTMVAKKAKRLQVKSILKYPSTHQKETYSARSSTSETFMVMSHAPHAGISLKAKPSYKPSEVSSGDATKADGSPKPSIDPPNSEVKQFSITQNIIDSMTAEILQYMASPQDFGKLHPRDDHGRFASKAEASFASWSDGDKADMAMRMAGQFGGPEELKKELLEEGEHTEDEVNQILALTNKHRIGLLEKHGTEIRNTMASAVQLVSSSAPAVIPKKLQGKSFASYEDARDSVEDYFDKSNKSSIEAIEGGKAIVKKFDDAATQYNLFENRRPVDEDDLHAAIQPYHDSIVQKLTQAIWQNQTRGSNLQFAAADFRSSLARSMTAEVTRYMADQRNPASDSDGTQAELIADILYHLYGDSAVGLLGEMPEHYAAAPMTGMRVYAWDESLHPRDNRGRFGKKNNAEAVAATHKHIQAALRGHRSAQSAKELADHLGNLTVNQLHALKKQYNIAAGGRNKAELIDKVAKRLDAGRREQAQQDKWDSMLAKRMEARGESPKPSGGIEMPSKSIDNTQAKAGDQLGLFGEGLKADSKDNKAAFKGAPKAKQKAMFDGLDDDPNQAFLFGDMDASGELPAGDKPNDKPTENKATPERKILGKRAGSAKVLAATFFETIDKEGNASILGQKISNPKDLAQLAQIYRNTNYETFRAFLVKDGKIVAHNAYSSRAPGLVVIPPHVSEQLQEDMKATKADGYYLLHNHPAGSPEPSREDISLTQQFAQKVPGMKAHVIINHTKGAVIQPNGESSLYSIDNKDLNDLSKAKVPHEYLDYKVDSPFALGILAKKCQPSGRDRAVVVFTNVKLNTRMIVDVDANELRRDSTKVAGAIRRAARMVGATQQFLVLPDNHAISDFGHLCRSGLFMDIANSKGNSARGAGMQFGPSVIDAKHKAYTLTREKVDDKAEPVSQPPSVSHEAKVAASKKQRPPRASTSPKSQIQDFGEKIGGARKDTAKPLGKRGQATPKDPELAGWRNRYDVSQVTKSSRKEEEGKWVIYDKKSKDWAGQHRQVGKPFDTKEEATKVLPVVEVARNHVVSQDPDNVGKFAIVRKVTDRKHPVVKGGFDSRDEAMMYMAQHPEQIIETKVRIDDSIHPELEGIERKGDDHRQGKSATPESFKQFGFRGVEFGKWNNAAERQHILNHAHDSLKDLANVLDLPDKAISMDGELALAFGSRGHGVHGGRAHYERDYGAINLTKIKGAGALAHEWMHALDHHLGRQSGKASSERVTNKHGDRVFKVGPDPSSDYVSHGHSYKKSEGYSDELKTAFNTLLKTVSHKEIEVAKDPSTIDKFHVKRVAELDKKLDDFRESLTKDYSNERYKPYRGKTANLPLPAEKMEEVDAIIAKLRKGEYGEKKLMPGKSSLGGPFTYKPLHRLNEIHKEHRGRNAYHTKSGGYASSHQGPLMDLHYNMQSISASKTQLDSANKGETETTKVRSDFHNSAKSMDKGTVKDYWSTPHELAARAFEAYVYDKLKAQGHRDDFLAYEKHNDLPAYRMFNVKPYPEGQERDAINGAFDKFFEVYRKSLKSSDSSKEQFSAVRPKGFPMMRPASMHELIMHYRAAGSLDQAVGGKPSGGSGRWITIGADKGAKPGHKGGTPVFVNSKGQITKGPSSLVKQTIDALTSDENPNKARWKREHFQPHQPKNRLDKAITEEVGHHPDDVKEFRDFVQQALSLHNGENAAYNREYDEAIGMLRKKAGQGLLVGRMRQAINKGKDSARMKGFDEVFDTAKQRFPRLLKHATERDPETALMLNLAAGKRSLLAAHDSQVIAKAKEMADSQGWTDHKEHLDTTKHERTAVKRAKPRFEADDFVPFAAGYTFPENLLIQA
jgi:proteasome lid subunit RPN8/RPN11